MVQTPSGRWLNRFIWFTAAATLLLICSGGMVTSKGAGLAVPDWPTTFGYNMFLFPVSHWVGGIFFEHTHRLIASVVGFLTIILAIWLWRDDTRPWVRRLGILALGAVILQGVLGGLRVTLLKDQIGVFHACLAQAFFGLIVFIGVVRSDFWRRGLLSESADGPNTIGRDKLVPPDTAGPASHWEGRAGLVRICGNRRRVAWIAVIATLLIYGQMMLGATMRHEHKDLSILDFPTVYHQWWPDTSPSALARINAWRDARALSDVSAFQIWLQMAHRFGAVLAGLAVISAGVRYRRSGNDAPVMPRLLSLWILGLFLQITLGAWTIWSNKAADIATAHVAVGAIMFALGVAISSIALRSSANPAAESPAQTKASVPVLA